MTTTPGNRRPLADQPESWPVVESTDLHRDDWVMALRSDRVQRPERPDDEPFARLVLEHPGAVIVLALDDDDRVLCLWQYRHPAQRSLVELPAGLCDGEGESPVEVARRELREEAELEAAHWTHLATVHTSPGISAEVMHFYLARDLTEVSRGDFEPEHEEAEMEVFWAPFEELLAAVLNGSVSDGPLVTGVLMAHARGLVGNRSDGGRRPA
jgi:ADP-ribose pyrophosphatase